MPNQSNSPTPRQGPSCRLESKVADADPDADPDAECCCPCLRAPTGAYSAAATPCYSLPVHTRTAHAALLAHLLCCMLARVACSCPAKLRIARRILGPCWQARAGRCLGVAACCFHCRQLRIRLEVRMVLVSTARLPRDSPCTHFPLLLLPWDHSHPSRPMLTGGEESWLMTRLWSFIATTTVTWKRRPNVAPGQSFSARQAAAAAAAAE